jgi:hypothetical protein
MGKVDQRYGTKILFDPLPRSSPFIGEHSNGTEPAQKGNGWGVGLDNLLMSMPGCGKFLQGSKYESTDRVPRKNYSDPVLNLTFSVSEQDGYGRFLLILVHMKLVQLNSKHSHFVNLFETAGA